MKKQQIILLKSDILSLRKQRQTINALIKSKLKEIRQLNKDNMTQQQLNNLKKKVVKKNKNKEKS